MSSLLPTEQIKCAGMETENNNACPNNFNTRNINGEANNNTNNNNINEDSLGCPTQSECEALKQALAEKQQQLSNMEVASLLESERQVELEDSVIAWQDKYDRLYESYKRVQKVNQSLEDKLLKLVDRNASEKAQLTSDVATLSVRLAQANFNIAKLQREIERYKADISLAIQLLQCKPESFVPQKVSSLPIDIQTKVSAYMRLDSSLPSDSEGSHSGCGSTLGANVGGTNSSGSGTAYKVLSASDSPPPTQCPFPPTAMVYSMRGLGKYAKNGADGILNNNMNMVTNPNSNSSSSSNYNNNSRKSSISNHCIFKNKINVTAVTAITTTTTTPTAGTGIKSNNSNNMNNTSVNCKSVFAQNMSPKATTTIGSGSAEVTITTNNITTSTVTITPQATNTSIDNEVISPVTMAKFLQHELKIGEVKHCETCQCANQDLTVLADVSRSYAVATQTPIQNANGNLNEPIAQLCLRCNSNLNSPSRTNSPYMLKLVKSSDSVISETKSSVSDLNETDKLFTPVKKDDLMVNPILSHHRLCERSTLNETLDVNAKLMSTTAGAVPLYGTNNAVWKSGSSQRGFFDGGGTALELLNKYEHQQTNISINKASNQEIEHLPRTQASTQEDTEDETKPLLSMQLQANLVESERHKFSEMIGLSRTVATTASVAAVEYLKSPAKCDSLMNSTLTGSVNSLWSRTSSSDGAKMFENFNRNLIKTIKAENPKHRGPRLCAMRIQQNGQSNIILDNVESIETPIVYKRRERLLDEELDDTKDIITSSLTSIKKTTATATAAAAVDSTTMCESALIDVEEPEDIRLTLPTDNAEHSISTQKTCSIMVDTNKEIAALEVGTLLPMPTLLPEGDIAKSVKSDSKSEIKTESKSIENAKITTINTTNSLPTTENSLIPKSSSETAFESSIISGNGTLQLNREQLKQHTAINNAVANYELLRNSCSSRLSLNSQSCTQSSSVSSNVLDYQESVTLRRQQLSRVAEWVQNNTQQLQEKQQQQEKDKLEIKKETDTQLTAESSGTDQQSSFSILEDRYDSISMEKLSLDSGYKTTLQVVQNVTKIDDKLHNTISAKTNNNQNNQQITTYYRRTTRSGLPVAYNSEKITPFENNICNYNHDESNNNSSNNSNNSTFMLTEQPTCDILDFKYYPKESDKTLLKSTTPIATTATTRPTQNVDIAQMEYNVKQFLLKQNEWSMRYNRLATTSVTTTATTTTTATAISVTAQQQTQQPQKLYKTVKKYPKFLVPGAVERVNCVTTTTENKLTTTPITTTTNSMSTAENKFVIRTPKRTETNL